MTGLVVFTLVDIVLLVANLILSLYVADFVRQTAGLDLVNAALRVS